MLSNSQIKWMSFGLKEFFPVSLLFFASACGSTAGLESEISSSHRSPSISSNRFLQFKLPIKVMSEHSGISQPKFARIEMSIHSQLGPPEGIRIVQGEYEVLFEGPIEMNAELLTISSKHTYGNSEWTLYLTLWGGNDNAACNYAIFEVEGYHNTVETLPINLVVGESNSLEERILKLMPEKDPAIFGTLAGALVDTSGRVIHKARLDYSQIFNGGPSQRVKEAAGGNFFINRLQAGNDTSIWVTANGYQSEKFEFIPVLEKDCYNNSANRIKIVLKPTP